jgi:voltage-gated potassium channel
MKPNLENIPEKEGIRRRLHIIIYGSDTYLGKLFDLILIIAIATSVFVVMLDSIASLRIEYGTIFWSLEWFFTGLFTFEYLIRIATVKKIRAYVFSFYGIIDLLAILPTYLSLLFPGTQYLVAIRVIRILRVFRILKLAQYISEANHITRALWHSRRKILVFLFSVLLICIFAGSLMYVVEGQENGFTSIPLSIYWAIVTLSTVGFGDLTPSTPLGQFISSIIMILGYGIIAVPTGIVTYEMSRNNYLPHQCTTCGHAPHDNNAKYCKECGSELSRVEAELKP